MRLTTLLCAICLCGIDAAAQRALFFKNHNLTAMHPVHRDVAAAIEQVCRGPSAGERAQGFVSHVPAGTQLLAARRRGSEVELVFDATLVANRRGSDLEHAIEQIDKTALQHPAIDRVRITIRGGDGMERSLAEVVDRPLPPPSATPAPPVAGIDLPQGALSGRRIAVSPGHGYYWHSSLGWTTQRGNIDGLIEDIHTAQIANRYLIPFLENMGAEVVLCRETGEQDVDGLVDNDQGAPAYTETGGWTTSASSGYQNSTYRFTSSTSGAETATASWQIPVQKDGLYPVFAWFRASGNRTPEANYRIHHTGGVATRVVDQTVDNLTWVHLGNYQFSAATGARIELSNHSPSPGVIIADAMRLGGGLGSIVRGGTTSLQERWRECARYWTQFCGAPSSVYNSVSSGQDNGDDVTARPRFAEWRTADAFVSLHTNAGGGAGTDTFIYSGGATAGSAQLSQAVHTQIVADLQAEWNPSWVDRGQQQANFGEVRLLSTMPGILVELAFHDTPGSLDHRSIHDPEFRYLAGRAYARGVMRFFNPIAVFPPEPPNALRVVQDGARGLRVEWDPVLGATHYTVEQSTDGKGFAEVADVAATQWSTGPLEHHEWRTFRVRAWNQSGRSFPTEVLSAGTDHLGSAQVLLVQAFDRVDRNVKGPENTRDYQHLVADAVRHDARLSLGFDAATNEAVQLGRVALADYDAVVWSLGEESTADETFSPLEQFLVGGYLNTGGSLLAHGAEIGWDLDAQGNAADRVFFEDVLGVNYISDDAGVYTLQAGVAGSISEGMAATTFDNGSGPTYDVDWPDVLAPSGAAGHQGSIGLRYGNGLTAAIASSNSVTGARTVVFGLPLETIASRDARARLLQQSLLFLMQDVQTMRGPTSAEAKFGQTTAFSLRLPGEANLQYMCGLSEAYAPGTMLPINTLLPLANGAILQASVTPNSPVFPGFLGTLDGSGSATATLFLPNLPFLAGLDVYVAGFSISPSLPVARKVSNWVRVRLTQ